MTRMVKGAIVLMAIIIASCSGGEDCTKVVQQSKLDAVNAAQLEIDKKIIDDYIIANDIANTLGPIQEVNGIKYVITQEGSGVTPCLENNVVVTYTGKLLSDGSTFDRNLSGVSFPLGNLILGWQLTFPTFTKGTSVTIFVPSGYAYGPSGFPPRIPGNANLIFDVDLTNVR
ncbi:MAG: FKBP-type peptidyl-prolyl cis-trans isomerase [Cyclobacteriaceae bacterium]|nr:FKBP-type peptidyl-prolyl cis-trans isomerase [Cyclobacteriaceae bacterium]